MPAHYPDVQQREGLVEALTSKLTACISVARFQNAEVFEGVTVELAPLLAETAAVWLYDKGLTPKEVARYSDSPDVMRDGLGTTLGRLWADVMRHHVGHQPKLIDNLARNWAKNLSGFLSRELDPKTLG